MTPSSRQAQQMRSVVPNVFVADVDAAVAFYTDLLGFELAYRHNDPECELAIMERDDVVLHICTCACEDKRHLGNSFFEVHVADAPALYAEYQAAKVPVKWELQHHSWGQVDFTIVDPEGNWVTFCSQHEDA